MKKLIYVLVIGFGVLFGCSSDDTKSTSKSTASNEPNGETIFKKNCVLCHGADGRLEFNGAKDLTKSVVPLDVRIQQITNGKGLMTPFNGILSEKEIRVVAEYTMSLNPNLK